MCHEVVTDYVGALRQMRLFVLAGIMASWTIAPASAEVISISEDFSSDPGWTASSAMGSDAEASSFGFNSHYGAIAAPGSSADSGIWTRRTTWDTYTTSIGGPVSDASDRIIIRATVWNDGEIGSDGGVVRPVGIYDSGSDGMRSLMEIRVLDRTVGSGAQANAVIIDSAGVAYQTLRFSFNEGNATTFQAIYDGGTRTLSFYAANGGNAVNALQLIGQVVLPDASTFEADIFGASNFPQGGADRGLAARVDNLYLEAALVPEPATLTLLGAALTLMARRRRDQTGKAGVAEGVGRAAA